MTLVTGASSGIGRAIALELAHRGYELVLTGRSTTELERVASQARDLGSPTVHQLTADLARWEGMNGLWHFLETLSPGVTEVVHCAGQGWVGPFSEMPEVLITRLNQLMVVTPQVLTRRLLETWGNNTRGRILIVSSTAAYQAGPCSAVYYASKAAVHRWAVGLQHELRSSRVSVAIATPGAVSSQFSARAGKRALAWSRSPEWVAECLVRNWQRGRKRIVPGWENRALLALTTVVPERTMARIIAGSQVPERN